MSSPSTPFRSHLLPLPALQSKRETFQKANTLSANVPRFPFEPPPTAPPTAPPSKELTAKTKPIPGSPAIPLCLPACKCVCVCVCWQLARAWQLGKQLNKVGISIPKSSPNPFFSPFSVLAWLLYSTHRRECFPFGYRVSLGFNLTSIERGQSWIRLQSSLTQMKFSFRNNEKNSKVHKVFVAQNMLSLKVWLFSFFLVCIMILVIEIGNIIEKKQTDYFLSHVTYVVDLVSPVC